MSYLDISKEVGEALHNGRPVVALESTIISHGMPYPQNVETAIQVENQVRESGAIPATIAIINGKMKAGLTTDEITLLGQEGFAVPKVSRRDFPYILSQGKNGATTVASTMIISAKAGIKIFATGGIGGVHRGAETTMDISADLQELANTDVAVVSAGAKSILDLGLTLEYLETMGVPVIGYRTEEFPAFYSRESGFGVDYRLDDAGAIASLLHAKWENDLSGGVLIANPVPESHALPTNTMDRVIEEAIRQAEQKGISGKKLTPFLLGKIKELTQGESLVSNIELVMNNARLAASIAIELAAINTPTS